MFLADLGLFLLKELEVDCFCRQKLQFYTLLKEENRKFIIIKASLTSGGDFIT